MQSIATPRVFAFVGLFAAMSLIAFAMPKRAAATTDPILTIFDDSLTTYLPSGATNIQDVRLRVGQRGVNIDGTMRSSPSQRMQIEGNPFEDIWPGPQLNGMRIDLGTYAVQDVDIALPADGFSWVIGRSYNARQETSGGSHRDSDGYQGKNWFQNSQPEILLHEHATDDDKDVVYMIYGADRFVEFERVDDDPTSDMFKATNGAAGVFLYEEGATDEPDTYTLTDQHGNEIVFFGFDADAGPADGQIWKITDPDSNTAYVGDATTGSTAISNGFNASGYITTAYDSSGRKYTYTYTQLDSVYRLTEVKAEVNSGGWTMVAEVDYEYYSDETYGDVGDLKLVEITTPLTDSGVTVVRKKYYRYWEGTFNDSTNPGHPHAIKYIVDYEGTRNQDWEDSTFDEDYVLLSNTNLETYAAAYFEYDSSHRIDLTWFNGECGCSGGNNGTHEFEWENNGSYSDTAGYNNSWMFRTIMQRPDTTYLTQYWGEAFETRLRVITDADPDNTSPEPNQWPTVAARNSDGTLSSMRMPNNNTDYDHAAASVTVSTTVGLRYRFLRASSGAMKGFLTDHQWRHANWENWKFVRQYEYTQADKEIVAASGVYVTRPLLSKDHDYDVVSENETPKITTSISPSEHSGELVVESTTTTNPSLGLSKLAPGSGTIKISYQRLDRTTSFVEAEDDVITYREYTDGQLTELIEDADTGETGDFDITVPGGLSSDSEALHRTTTYAYDDQGRLDTITQPDGRVIKQYYSKLSDGRLVTLRYNDYDTSPSTKFFGPVEYMVRNHAGKVEAQATVALTSNESTTALTGHVDETDDDPITAMDLGTVARLTTGLYDDTGSVLEESRLYFDIPSSGNGTDGTNYDPTVYGYDDMGRRWRVKEASGTIRRTVFNSQGLVSERHIGTNDSTFSGGEPSGTDDTVMIEELEYDDADDFGNGYLTKRTLYVEDSATDKRVTTYTNDVRGNAEVQKNPTAPHYFYRYNNRGQVDATGVFSSTVNITVGADDPTTETSNRIGLSQNYYDKLGRVYKTTVHKIDVSDGSDDDNLVTEYTLDEVGRRIKEEGRQLVKTYFDRLGRPTHRFILANDDDTDFADAKDLVLDTVLEEHQTHYDSDPGDVLMRVVVMRDANDSDTGALDDNADSDDLLITAANLSGRAQITAYWYDAFGRQTDQVLYGTYGGSNFDRDALSVPTRSDTALRTTTEYDTDGTVLKRTDPRNLVAYFENDDAGRQTKVVRNYDASVNSGNPSGTDDNQTVKYEYTDGLRTKITADMPSGGTDQDTIYTYGTTKGTSAGESNIGTGHLLQKVQYPDSSGGTDVVTYAYNAQSQQIYTKDQSGNVTEVDFEDSGRQEHRRVTTLASGFDGAVRRISRTYASSGRPDLVTQYDNATVGSGSVVDEVSYSYDNWGNVSKFEQDRNSAVGAVGSVDDYEVSYSYAKATGGRHAVRRTDMTMPSGNVIDYDYTLDEDGDSSRVSKIKDGATVLCKYEYLGAGIVSAMWYEEPGIMSEVHGSDTYPDWDRFNRVTSSRWTADLATDIDFYDVDLTWDRNSNITLAEDNIHPGFDVEYTIDDLDRLVDAEEGTWNGSTITTRTRHQIWTLSHTGNWDIGKLDLDGDDNWNETDEYNDDRTHNAVNELTARDTDDNGTDDHTLVYDAVGNLTDDDEDYEYEYDAFGRLRKVNDQTPSLVAEYKYNGLGFMISVHEDTDDDADVDNDDRWYHSVYDEIWRKVATFREDKSVPESDTDPKEEFVNHQAGADGKGGSSYINAVVLRDKDANTAWTAASDGTLEERMYYCQNWRGDVIGLVATPKALVETPRYSSYGVPMGIPGADTDSDFDCDSTDVNQVQSWIDTSSYDIRGDVDLDGTVDAGDKNVAQNYLLGTTLGWGNLSAVGNRRSSAGYMLFDVVAVARHRAFSLAGGRWVQRDPMIRIGSSRKMMGMAIGEWLNQYGYVDSQPTSRNDPLGLCYPQYCWRTCRGKLFLIGLRFEEWDIEIPVYGECEYKCGPPTHPCRAPCFCPAKAPYTKPATLTMDGWECPTERAQGTCNVLDIDPLRCLPDGNCGYGWRFQ